jgi:Asp-tRNA(Asn)/Glu-tRNA(Gln) amidotransferase A subunit family amidase
MMNPLLQKYEELYGKKEKPKLPRIEDYEGEETFADELKKPKPPILKSYDLDDLKASFQQVAEKLQNNEAQVVSMNMEFGDHMNKLTFEVYVYKP